MKASAAITPATDSSEQNNDGMIMFIFNYPHRLLTRGEIRMVFKYIITKHEKREPFALNATADSSLNGRIINR